MASVAGLGSEDEALVEAVRSIVPRLSGADSQKLYKGQCGKIAVIGGSREYTGAPYFAAISALKAGADLSHVFCPIGAAPVIKSYSPELIVHPYLQEMGDLGQDPSGDEVERAANKAAEQVRSWLDRFDAVVIGPGLGRDPLVHSTVKMLLGDLLERKKPVVIDADGLYMVTKEPQLVRGNPNCILTPNHNEFRRLAAQLSVNLENKGDGEALAEIAADLKGPTIVQKGQKDAIGDGAYKTVYCSVQGSPRRPGGQGDILSGTIATLLAWAGTLEARGGSLPQQGIPSTVVASWGACVVVRSAARAAFSKQSRAMLASDMIPELGPVIDQQFGEASDG